MTVVFIIVEGLKMRSRCSVMRDRQGQGEKKRDATAMKEGLFSFNTGTLGRLTVCLNLLRVQDFKGRLTLFSWKDLAVV